MPNYDVHLYPIVHIKVLGVKAESMKEAIKRTLDTLDWHRLLASKQNFSDIAYIEFAEVLRSWESFQAKCKEEYDEREADEECKRKEAWEAEKKEVALIMEDLKLYLPYTYTPTLWEKNEGIIHIKFNGHTYEIQRHDSGQ